MTTQDKPSDKEYTGVPATQFVADPSYKLYDPIAARRPNYDPKTWTIDWESVGDIELLQGVNWNVIQDPVDLNVWNRANANVWWPEKIALSNDLSSWHTFSPHEKLITTRIFTGLTVLDTIQARIGAKRMELDARTEHECAVFDQFGYMEQVHARSYSSVFATLNTSKEIAEAYRWSRENVFLKKKAQIITAVYNSGDPLKIKIASAMLEGFLFYSGFFLPMYWTTQKKLMNTGDLIKLIIRDEAIHCFYIGYKYQLGIKDIEDPELREMYHTYAMDLFMLLYENELGYTEQMYDQLGLTEQVKALLHYNANKTFMNLGYDPIFPEEECKVDPEILAPMIKADNHDFFSGAGSSYVMLDVRDTTDEAWAGIEARFAELHPTAIAMA